MHLDTIFNVVEEKTVVLLDLEDPELREYVEKERGKK